MPLKEPSPKLDNPRNRASEAGSDAENTAVTDFEPSNADMDKNAALESPIKSPPAKPDETPNRTDKINTPETAYDPLGSPVESIDPHVIRASSTPKAQIEGASQDAIHGELAYSGGALRRSRQSSTAGDERAPDEMTPLLDSDGSEAYVALEEGLQRQLRGSNHQTDNRNGWSRHICLNMWCGAVGIALVLMIVLIFFMVFINLPMLLDQAVTSDILRVSVSDVSDSGLKIHVVGSTYINYENVSNRLYGQILRMVSLFIGAVKVAPKGASRVYLSGEGIARGHVLDMFLPEVMVNLLDQSLTEYDFKFDALFNEESLPRLLEEFMNHDQTKPLPLRYEIEIAPLITAKGLHFSSGIIQIEDDYTMPPDKLKSLISLEELELDAQHDSITLRAIVVLDVIPASMNFEAIQWNVSIADCSEQPAYLGLMTSSSFKVSPDKLSEVLVDGKINEIPHNLLEPCEDNQTPFNNFVSKITNDGTLEVFLLAADSEENSRNLPPWFFRILKLANIKLSIPVSSTGGFSLHDKVLDVSLTSIDLKFPDSSLRKNFVDMSCKVAARLQLPGMSESFEAKLTNWTSSLEFHDNSTTLARASTIESSSVSFKGQTTNETSVSARFDRWNFDLFDYDSFGKLINNWINGKELGKLPAVDANIKQVDLELSLLNTTLRDIQLRNIQLDKTSLANFAFNRNGSLNWLLLEMNISLPKIKLVGSGRSFVHFAIEVEVNNPLPLSLHMLREQMSFGIIYEDVDIGNVTFDLLLLPQTADRIKNPAHIRVDCPTFGERNAAEKFASVILSGARNVTVGVKGLPMSPSSDIGKVIQWIHVPNVLVPHLTFPLPEKGVEAPKQELSQSSPFLLEVTIHILSSDVELLVFNPITNQGLAVNILLCQAIYEDKVLAYTDNAGSLTIPPGLYRTKRIPYKVGSGVSSDILQRALNGELEVIVKSDMLVTIGEFTGQVLLQIEGVTAKVRW